MNRDEILPSSVRGEINDDSSDEESSESENESSLINSPMPTPKNNTTGNDVKIPKKKRGETKNKNKIAGKELRKRDFKTDTVDKQDVMERWSKSIKDELPYDDPYSEMNYEHRKESFSMSKSMIIIICIVVAIVVLFAILIIVKHIKQKKEEKESSEVIDKIIFDTPEERTRQEYEDKIDKLTKPINGGDEYEEYSDND